MIKNTTVINSEDLRRNLGLPPCYTIKAIVMEENEIKIEAESPIVSGDSIKKIPGEELTKVIGTIETSMRTGKEIMFSYYNERRDGIEITSRKFIPQKWINQDCIEGFDLEKKETRRFCPSRMEWIESIVTG